MYRRTFLAASGAALFAGCDTHTALDGGFTAVRPMVKVSG